MLLIGAIFFSFKLIIILQQEKVVNFEFVTLLFARHILAAVILKLTSVWYAANLKL